MLISPVKPRFSNHSRNSRGRTWYRGGSAMPAPALPVTRMPRTSGPSPSASRTWACGSAPPTASAMLPGPAPVTASREARRRSCWVGPRGPRGLLRRVAQVHPLAGRWCQRRAGGGQQGHGEQQQQRCPPGPGRVSARGPAGGPQGLRREGRQAQMLSPLQPVSISANDSTDACGRITVRFTITPTCRARPACLLNSDEVVSNS